MEGDWEVVMDDIVFFSVIFFMNKINFFDRMNFIIIWFFRRGRNFSQGDRDIVYVFNFIKYDFEEVIFIVDGIGFMKIVFGFFVKW